MRISICFTFLCNRGKQEQTILLNCPACRNLRITKQERLKQQVMAHQKHAQKNTNSQSVIKSRKSQSTENTKVKVKEAVNDFYSRHGKAMTVLAYE